MKKQLIFVNGTMGAGKSTVCRALADRLTPCVFLDGDWCWDMHPFVVNEENKAMVLGNIAYLLNAFLANTSLTYVIFCWVMQEERIIEEICARLQGAFDLHVITLMVREDVLRARLARDIAAGLRDPGIVERSLARLPAYDGMKTVKLDVSDITAEQAADRIVQMVQERGSR